MNKPINSTIYHWPGHELSAGNLTLGIAPIIGGRILSLKYQNQELFFVNEEHAGEIYDLASINDPIAEKIKMGYRLWGGDKTWVAPQSSWQEPFPPLDLNAGQYQAELENNAITMTSPIDRETGLQIIRRVELLENDQFMLDQTFVNKSDHEIQCAIWDVTQLQKPFDIYLPVDSNKLEADERFPASIHQRESLISQENCAWSKITCKDPLEFKYGALINKGQSLAIRKEDKETLIISRQFDINPNAQYPDNHMAEVYNSEKWNYLELETLGPLVTLKAGEKTSHQIKWIISKTR